MNEKRKFNVGDKIYYISHLGNVNCANITRITDDGVYMIDKSRIRFWKEDEMFSTRKEMMENLERIRADRQKESERMQKIYDDIRKRNNGN